MSRTDEVEDRSTMVVPSRENRILARRRRQTLTFLGLFTLVILIGVVAFGNWVQWWTIGGQAVATPVTCPVQVFTDPHLTKVNVYNGTSRSGLAAAVAKELSNRGFQMNEISNEQEAKPIPAAAFIRYGASGVKEAQTVSREFPGRLKLVRDNRPDNTVDVVLGEGYKLMVAKNVAKKAIALKPEPADCVDPNTAGSPTS